MYNAAIICTFNVCGFVVMDYKKLIAIPFKYRRASQKKVFQRLLAQDKDGFEHILAVKFVNIKRRGILPLNSFKILRKNYEVLEETDWYINEIYDGENLMQIDKLADPAIILREEKGKAKERINYYVGLRRSGYSEEESLNLVYS